MDVPTLRAEPAHTAANLQLIKTNKIDDKEAYRYEHVTGWSRLLSN